MVIQLIDGTISTKAVKKVLFWWRKAALEWTRNVNPPQGRKGNWQVLTFSVLHIHGYTQQSIKGLCCCNDDNIIIISCDCIGGKCEGYSDNPIDNDRLYMYMYVQSPWPINSPSPSLSLSLSPSPSPSPSLTLSLLILSPPSLLPEIIHITIQNCASHAYVPYNSVWNEKYVPAELS